MTSVEDKDRKKHVHPLGSTSDPSGTGQAAPLRERMLVPALVVIGLVVALVSSLGAPLIPTIAAADHVSIADAQWSLTIALLGGTAAAPILGRLGDGPHRRTVIITTVAAVFVGSLLAALPLGFAALLVGRALQGTGLGLIPLVLSVARDHLPAERVRPAIALLSVTAVGGVGLGYPITGVIAEDGGLHGAFWFGVAASGIALALAWLVIPDSSTRAARKLDVTGAVLLGSGFSVLLYALANAQIWGWASTRLLLIGGVAVALLSAAMVETLRSAHPIVDLRLFRHRGVLVANVTAVLQGIGMYLTMSMVIRLAQTPASTGYGVGASVAMAGLILLPLSITSLISSRVMTLLLHRGVRLSSLLPLGTTLMAVSMVVFCLMRGSLLQLGIVLAVVGLGTGISASVMPALILESVPSNETGSATGFNQVLRNAGMSVGSALSGAILEAHTPAGQVLPTTDGFQVGGYVGLGLCVLTIAVVLPLLPRRPRTSSRNPTAEELRDDQSPAEAMSEADAPFSRNERVGQAR